MRATGIICEYNPLHQGHIRQLTAARQDTSADVVICVMSEHLTQRGELAVADPYTRAAAAISCGADLVIGLPFPYSASPAEFFARAAIRILNAMGASALHFGSESSLEILTSAVDILSSADFSRALVRRQRTHPEEGVMSARETVFSELAQRPLPGGSNDLLATAYLEAIRALHSPLRPFRIRREGQEYRDDTAPSLAAPASAAALRHLWEKDGLPAIRPYLPADSYHILEEATRRGIAPLRVNDALNGALLWYYRTVSPQALSTCAGMEGGLGNRLIRSAKESGTLAEMAERATAKHYTASRVRRAVWMGACQVNPEDLNTPPAYVRLLAANPTGQQYLAQLRRTRPLPILTKPSRLPPDALSSRQAITEARLEALLSLAYPSDARQATRYKRCRPWFPASR